MCIAGTKETIICMKAYDADNMTCIHVLKFTENKPYSRNIASF